MLSKEKAEEILGKGKRGYRFSPARFLGYFELAQALLAGGKVKVGEYDTVKSAGWCQGAYARTRSGHKLESAKSKLAASFCAQGALERVVPEYRDFRVCKSLLSYALGVMPNGRWSIASLNDGHDKEMARVEIRTGYTLVIECLRAL